ncbi:hypothetical protein F0223_21445 [Vibrio coralliilyticus]|nr:hypothetical protein [Vibrio coralliilyticus]
MTRKVFLSNFTDWTTPSNSQLVKDLKQYFQKKVLPSTIGRDAPLKRPKDAQFAGLMHIHIGTFNDINYQYYRTSDDWVIYATGLYTDSILIIDVLSPDAHSRSEQLDLMSNYIKLGDEFRNQF